MTALMFTKTINTRWNFTECLNASLLLGLELVHPDVPREEIPVIQHNMMRGHGYQVVSIGVNLA
jgi:hypothetical protein